MSTAINRTAPTVGAAIGYFAVVIWAIPEGHLDKTHVVEAVLFAGVLATNALMEFRALILWIGSLIKKDKEE